MEFNRICLDPAVMGGKPCIKGKRVTVGTIVGLLPKGHTTEEILKLYPYLEKEDITQALGYAGWRSEEREVDLKRRERESAGHGFYRSDATVP